jgi:hypothetical protein
MEWIWRRSCGGWRRPPEDGSLHYRHWPEASCRYWTRVVAAASSALFSCMYKTFIHHFGCKYCHHQRLSLRLHPDLIQGSILPLSNMIHSCHNTMTNMIKDFLGLNRILMMTEDALNGNRRMWPEGGHKGRIYDANQMVWQWGDLFYRRHD